MFYPLSDVFSSLSSEHFHVSSSAAPIVLFIYFAFSWQLSMWRCNEELRARADELHRSSRRDAKHYIGMHSRFQILIQILFLKLFEILVNTQVVFSFLLPYFLFVKIYFIFLYSPYPNLRFDLKIWCTRSFGSRSVKVLKLLSKLNT